MATSHGFHDELADELPPHPQAAATDDRDPPGEILHVSRPYLSRVAILTEELNPPRSPAPSPNSRSGPKVFRLASWREWIRTIGSGVDRQRFLRGSGTDGSRTLRWELLVPPGTNPRFGRAITFWARHIVSGRRATCGRGRHLGSFRPKLIWASPHYPPLLVLPAPKPIGEASMRDLLRSFDCGIAARCVPFRGPAEI